MALDYEEVWQQMIDIAREAVGERLSKLPPSNSFASVIRAYENENRPKAPYITVTLLATRDESGDNNNSLYHTWLTEDDRNEVGSVKQVSFNYRCEGKESHSIINQLINWFKLDSNKDKVRKRAGIGIVEITPAFDLPTVIADKKYIPATETTLTINILDVVVDESTTDIGTISLDGEFNPSSYIEEILVTKDEAP